MNAIPMERKIPVIFLAFANDHEGCLKKIDQERRKIVAALQHLHDRHAILVWAEPEVSLKDLFSVMRHYDQRIAIFHYGGHATGTHLLLEGENGNPSQAAYAEGIGSLLGDQSLMQLVFLNGCATYDQVKMLQDKGVRAVIASSARIDDAEASVFAEQFFLALGKGTTIGKAFEDAGKYLLSQFQNIALPQIYRGIIIPGNESDPNLLPWGLYLREGCDDVATWKLPQPPAIELTKIPDFNLQTGFLGRKKDLQRLEKQLQNTAQALLVNGLGGIGKTTLARAYVHQHNNDYQHIVWISGAENVQTAFARNQDLATNLDMPFREKEHIQERLIRVLQRLRGLSAPGNGSNLLVIDNATATITEKAMRNELPGPPGWHVLVTSREELDGFQLLKLDTLDPEAARELFRAHYKGRVGEEELETLLITIGYHTLTIELLSKMLQRMINLLTITQLTEKLNQHELDDPYMQETKVWTWSSQEQQTVYKHLIHAFELSALSNEEKYVLANLAVLPAESYTVTFLAELLNIEARPLNWLLHSLADKGWINRYDKGGFSMHRMIQKVTILILQPDFSHLSKISNELLLLLNKPSFEIFSTSWSSEDWSIVSAAEHLVLYFETKKIENRTIIELMLKLWECYFLIYATPQAGLEKIVATFEKYCSDKLDEKLIRAKIMLVNTQGLSSNEPEPIKEIIEDVIAFREQSTKEDPLIMNFLANHIQDKDTSSAYREKYILYLLEDLGINEYSIWEQWEKLSASYFEKMKFQEGLEILDQIYGKFLADGIQETDTGLMKYRLELAGWYLSFKRFGEAEKELKGILNNIQKTTQVALETLTFGNHATNILLSIYDRLDDSQKIIQLLETGIASYFALGEDSWEWPFKLAQSYKKLGDNTKAGNWQETALLQGVSSAKMTNSLELIAGNHFGNFALENNHMELAKRFYRALADDSLCEPRRREWAKRALNAIEN